MNQEKISPNSRRLTLEEQNWFQRRKGELQQYSTVGGVIGAVLGTAVTVLGPFKRKAQIAAILGTCVIGAGSGYLYADAKALNRVADLSAQSSLRKEYQQLMKEKKARKTM